MKSKILSFVTLIVVLGFSNLTYAAGNNNMVVTTLTDVSVINKIEVQGNVELFVSDGTANQVKVYNQYYGESAYVQNRNGVLRISSYKAEKLVVWVTASNLRSIVAYDNAEVKSFGKIAKIEFSVELHNNASAKLNLDAYILNVNLTDHAKADLTGNADEFSLSREVATTINQFGFKADRFTERKINLPVAKDIAVI